MSSTEAARQRLDSLRKQQTSYREKLQQQEVELRRLQNEVFQNRTVVEVTLPGEIKKAYGEYMEILKKSNNGSLKPTHQDDAVDLEQELSQHGPSASWNPLARFFSLFVSASPGSLLSLLTFTTTILFALYDTVLCAAADKILAQFLVVLGFFFPAVAYAQRQSRRAAQAGGPGQGCAGGGYGYGGRRGSTRFAPIHM